MISASDNLAICATDTPAVAALKRRFFALDTRAEQLKPLAGKFAAARAELELVTEQKRVIGAEIFGSGHVVPGMV